MRQNNKNDEKNIFARLTQPKFAEKFECEKITLNGNEEKFSAKTVEKVLASKDILGYLPDYVARQMITKGTKTIGVLVPDITNPFFNTLMRGIEDVLYKQNFVTILCNADSDHQKEIEFYIDEEISELVWDKYIKSLNKIPEEIVFKKYWCNGKQRKRKS